MTQSKDRPIAKPKSHWYQALSLKNATLCFLLAGFSLRCSPQKPENISRTNTPSSFKLEGAPSTLPAPAAQTASSSPATNLPLQPLTAVNRNTVAAAPSNSTISPQSNSIPQNQPALPPNNTSGIETTANGSVVDMAKITVAYQNYPSSQLMNADPDTMPLLSILTAYSYNPKNENRFKVFAENWFNQTKQEIKSKLLGRDRCGSYQYPTIDNINKRRKIIIKNDKLRNIVCLPGSPYQYLCQTFSEMILLDDQTFTAKLVTDTDFSKNVRTIDSLLITVRKPETGMEVFYNVFQQFSLDLHHELELAILSGKQIDTIFIGDSLMMLFKGNHEQTFKNAVFMGIGGDRTDNLITRIAINLAQIKPTNVVVSVSGNDILEGCNRDQVHKDRLTLVTLLGTLGVKNIFWMALPPASVDKFTHAQLIIEENFKIASMPGIRFIDSYTPMVVIPGLIKPQYFLDGIHVSNQAYDEVWVPLLKAKGL